MLRTMTCSMMCSCKCTGAEARLTALHYCRTVSEMAQSLEYQKSSIQSRWSNEDSHQAMAQAFLGEVYDVDLLVALGKAFGEGVLFRDIFSEEQTNSKDFTNAAVFTQLVSQAHKLLFNCFGGCACVCCQVDWPDGHQPPTCR